MDVADWTAIEMHGTGTALGDPIEIGAAAAVTAAGMHGENQNRVRMFCFRASPMSCESHSHVVVNYPSQDEHPALLKLLVGHACCHFP